MAEYRVESVEKALLILNAFSSTTGTKSLSALTAETALNKSTILRILGSLERFGYVVRDRGNLYRVGPSLLRFDATAIEPPDFNQIIRLHLKHLKEETGETASFYIRIGDERLCLLREIGSGELRHFVEEGTRLDLNKGATARALLSKEPNDDVHISMGERLAGISALSIPIYDFTNKMAGAITLSGSSGSFSPENIKFFMKLLKESAKQLRQQKPLRPISICQLR